MLSPEKETAGQSTVFTVKKDQNPHLVPSVQMESLYNNEYVLVAFMLKFRGMLNGPQSGDKPINIKAKKEKKKKLHS